MSQSLPSGDALTGERSVRFETNGPSPQEVMRWLRDTPPTSIAGYVITGIDDLTETLVFHLDGADVTIRASDTEAELTLLADRAQTHGQLTALLNAFSAYVCDPERSQTAALIAAAAPAADSDIEERADDLFSGAPTSLSREEALRLTVECIDLTTLAGDDTDGRVRALCAQARRPDPTDPTVGPTAAVCVYPNLVPIAVELTEGSGVAVASVAGAFPSGLSSLEVRLSDIAEAVCAGADEVDVVLNRAAFLAGHDDVVRDELREMRQQIGSRAMKVILETSELETPAAIRKASLLAMQAGAEWIKTSTGKSGVGATPVVVLAMATAIKEHVALGADPVGLKISGGVRTSDQALGYLAIIEATLGPDWLQPNRVRFGASGLLSAVVDDLGSNP